MPVQRPGSAGPAAEPLPAATSHPAGSGGECEHCRRASMQADPGAGRRIQSLTRREREVWLLVGVGLSNADIAQTLHINGSTVKKHVAAIVRKVGAFGRIEATQLAALWHQANCPVAARAVIGENWFRRTIANRIAA